MDREYITQLNKRLKQVRDGLIEALDEVDEIVTELEVGGSEEIDELLKKINKEDSDV